MTCPVCGSPMTSARTARRLARPLRPDDLRITDSRYGTTLALRRCHACGFVFAEGDEVAQLTTLYAAVSDPAYEESEEARALQMRWLLGRALAVSPAARSVLDVGAASGLLVAEARRRGLEAVGVEPSLALATRARVVHGVEVVHGAFPHPVLTGRRFDIVFLADVLEHVADPVGLLRAARDALSPWGLLVVVTPDLGSVAARILRARWWHFRLAHVGYFDRRSLVAATSAAGLTWVAESRATWFLPVGYLAERLGAGLLRLPGARSLTRMRRAPRGPTARRLTSALRGVGRRAIRLDLRDSFAVFLRRRQDVEGVARVDALPRARTA
jgi:2-polyprenyl-3-methyl-5-hydroxy-6-metoxy-1,4-benzoquinol methylase